MKSRQFVIGLGILTVFVSLIQAPQSVILGPANSVAVNVPSGDPLFVNATYSASLINVDDDAADLPRYANATIIYVVADGNQTDTFLELQGDDGALGPVTWTIGDGPYFTFMLNNGTFSFYTIQMNATKNGINEFKAAYLNGTDQHWEAANNHKLIIIGGTVFSSFAMWDNGTKLVDNGTIPLIWPYIYNITSPVRVVIVVNASNINPAQIFKFGRQFFTPWADYITPWDEPAANANTSLRTFFGTGTTTNDPYYFTSTIQINQSGTLEFKGIFEEGADKFYEPIANNRAVVFNATITTTPSQAPVLVSVTNASTTLNVDDNNADVNRFSNVTITYVVAGGNQSDTFLELQGDDGALGPVTWDIGTPPYFSFASSNGTHSFYKVQMNATKNGINEFKAAYLNGTDQVWETADNHKLIVYGATVYSSFAIFSNGTKISEGINNTLTGPIEVYVIVNASNIGGSQIFKSGMQFILANGTISMPWNEPAVNANATLRTFFGTGTTSNDPYYFSIMVKINVSGTLEFKAIVEDGADKFYEPTAQNHAVRFVLPTQLPTSTAPTTSTTPPTSSTGPTTSPGFEIAVTIVAAAAISVALVNRKRKT